MKGSRTAQAASGFGSKQIIVLAPPFRHAHFSHIYIVFEIYTSKNFHFTSETIAEIMASHAVGHQTKKIMDLIGVSCTSVKKWVSLKLKLTMILPHTSISLGAKKILKNGKLADAVVKREQREKNSYHSKKKKR